MNRRSPGLQLSKALVGFLQYKAAEGLSPNTLRNYKDHLTRWLDYAGEDTEVSQVTSQDLRAYLAWLRSDYKPRRLRRVRPTVQSRSTVRESIWDIGCAALLCAIQPVARSSGLRTARPPRLSTWV